jgi:hypothetical protein
MLKSLLCLACVVTLIASVMWGLIAWISPAAGPEATFRWSVRIGACVLGPLSLILLVVLAVKADRLPDFLWRVPGRHFGRGGVVFAFQVAPKDGVCWVKVHYQNRFEKGAQLSVLIRPSKGFISGPSEIEPIAVSFPCGPAAYGVVSVPLAIDHRYQGTQQCFDVGASIAYPKGTGELLRNRVGERMSSVEMPGPGSLVMTVVRVALSGHPPLSLGIPTRIRFRLPTCVRETAEGLPEIEHREEWVFSGVNSGSTPINSRDTTRASAGDGAQA